MKQTGLRLPEELIARIHEDRGDVPFNTWVLRACEQALKPAVESHSDLRDRVKRPTVADVLDARGGHSIGRASDLAPLTKPADAYKPIPKKPAKR